MIERLSPIDGRHQIPLYVTEKQIIERMGVGINAGRKAVQTMRLDARFPPRSIGGKRYWPSVVDFLDEWNGRLVAEPATPPPHEPYRRRSYENLQIAKQRLNKRMEDAAVIDLRFAAIANSIGRILDPALMKDPELRAFLIAEDIRMANKASRRRPSLEASMIALAESRLRSTQDKE